MSDQPMPPELVLVIPVYNEQDAIVAVLDEWRTELDRHLKNYLILVVDDGSTDATPTRLNALGWDRLRIHRHTNRGHGQSCLVGYQEAVRLGARHVFQIDSDGQCDPVGFARMWAHRASSPAIYGRRTDRDDGVARKIISFCLRCLLKLSWKTRLNDTNVPFRLYDATLAADTAKRIPGTFDLANIAMALLMEPHGFVEEPIHFRDRVGGHASVRWWGFVRKARRLCRDLKGLQHHA